MILAVLAACDSQSNRDDETDTEAEDHMNHKYWDLTHQHPGGPVVGEQQCIISLPA